MNFETALNILGLQKNYTEADLNKAYKNLLIEYIPDKWKGKSRIEKKFAKEKYKKIKEAKKLLEKQIKTNNSNTKLMEEKQKLYRDMVSYKLMLTRMNTNTNIIIISTIEKLVELNKNCIYKIKTANNLDELNNEIIRFKAHVWSILDNFTIEYCKYYNITTNIDKLEKYWFNKLFEKLEQIKNEQHKISSILDEKEKEYMLCPEYNILKEEIEQIKKHVIYMYHEKYTNDETVIKHFTFRIELAFREYNRRLEVINNFKNLNYNDEFVISHIQLMEENIFENPLRFNNLEAKLQTYIDKKESKTLKKIKNNKK